MCYQYSVDLKLDQEWDEAVKQGRIYEWIFESGHDPKEIAGQFQFYVAKGFAFPTLPVISSADPEGISWFDWGLIPHWSKDEKKAKEMRKYTLNARSETVFEKPSFRSAIKSKRCLILASGFFEYKHLDGDKIPHYIWIDGEPIFAIAGIWDEWTNKATGEIKRSYAVLTTEANPMMAEIHNSKKRMPIILPPELQKEWIDPQLPKADIASCMVQIDDDKMRAHPVSKLLHSRKEDPNVPEVQEEYDYAL